MHASQLSVSLLQFTNPFGILTILAFSLFVNNSEKIELWVPLMGPLLRYLGPLLVPFLLKVGSPLGPLFRIFGSPFDCGTVKMHATFLYISIYYQLVQNFLLNFPSVVTSLLHHSVELSSPGHQFLGE